MGFIDKKRKVVQHYFPGLIGRRPEITAVKYAIKQMGSRSPRVQVKDFPNIFYFYGPTGSGKTTVLETTYQHCQNGELGFRPLCIWYDCAETTQSDAIALENFMLSLARSVVKADKMLAKYAEPLFETWQDFQAGKFAPQPPPEANLQKPAVANKINPVRAAYAPYGNMPVKKMKDGSHNVKAIADNLTKAMETLKKENLPKAIDSRQLILDKFIEMVDQISASHRIVFFIDNYHYFEKYDTWFRKHLLPAFERELIFVIAGENDLSKPYQAEFGNLVYPIPMLFFSVFSTEAFLRMHNAINDPKLVIGTQQLSSGNPLAVSMISAAFHSLNTNPEKMLEFVEWPGDEYGEKINKYIAYIMMDYIAKGDRNLLGLLAVMRCFDWDLFQNLAGVLNPKRTIETLSKKYRFISEEGKMHDWVKNILRGYVKKDLPSLYHEINQGAYDYFTEQVRADPEKYELLYDSLYYYFQLEAQAAYNHFLLLISHYLSTNLDFCDRLCVEVMACAIPQSMKSDVRSIAHSLGYFRKKDPKESKHLMEIISTAQEEEKEDLQFLQF